jgi:hypothetical protein
MYTFTKTDTRIYFQAPGALEPLRLGREVSSGLCPRAPAPAHLTQFNAGEKQVQTADTIYTVSGCGKRKCAQNYEKTAERAHRVLGGPEPAYQMSRIVFGVTPYLIARSLHPDMLPRLSLSSTPAFGRWQKISMACCFVIRSRFAFAWPSLDRF